MASKVVIVVDKASQPAFCAGLTGVPRFVETVNSHRDGLKELLDDVSVGVVEIAVEVSASKSSEIAHAVNEEFGVFDGVTVFELMKEPRRGLRAPTR